MMQDRVAWNSEWPQSKSAGQVEHNLEMIGCNIITIVRLPKAQEHERGLYTEALGKHTRSIMVSSWTRTLGGPRSCISQASSQHGRHQVAEGQVTGLGGWEVPGTLSHRLHHGMADITSRSSKRCHMIFTATKQLKLLDNISR